MVASRNKHLHVVAFLLEKDADPSLRNNTGESALHIAAGLGYLEIAKLLLAHGAIVSAHDHNDETPLHLGTSMSLHLVNV